MIERLPSCKLVDVGESTRENLVFEELQSFEEYVKTDCRLGPGNEIEVHAMKMAEIIWIWKRLRVCIYRFKAYDSLRKIGRAHV